MKLHVLSDLHLEFGDFTYPDVGADLVILSGDIHQGKKGLKWAFQQIPDIPTLYIVGNHEYYYNLFPDLADGIRAISKDTFVHFLENDTFQLNGWRFFGATLWTDFQLSGGISDQEATETMNDYRLVTDSRTQWQLRPDTTREAHAHSLNALIHFLQEGDPAQSIVLTHHLPTHRSIAEPFIGDPHNAFFASDLSDLIEEFQPTLWVHGHSHHARDYTIGRTRVINNPRGYVHKEENTGFEPCKTVILK